MIIGKKLELRCFHCNKEITLICNQKHSDIAHRLLHGFEDEAFNGAKLVSVFDYHEIMLLCDLCLLRAKDAFNKLKKE